jgi:hypothetical protein
MSHILESKKVRMVLYILGGLIILFVVFGFGIAVGYQRAGFAMGFDRNYYRNFYGVSPGVASGTMAPPVPVAGHGVVGTIIDLSSSTISLTDQSNNEHSIAISSGTVIRDGDSDSAISGMAVGDQIAVIGEPDSNGQIDARFIRIIYTK